MNPRGLAALVLSRVWTDGAFAAAVLSNSLDRSGMAPRDRALSTEMSYGVLRCEGYLVRRLSAYGKLKLGDHLLLAHLLVAAYQIEFLDRIPPSAAVNEAVSLVRECRGSRVGGFANAILRQLAGSPSESRASLREAVLQSSPSWLRKRLFRELGEEGATALLVPQRTPSSYLRLTRPASVELVSWLGNKTQSCKGVRDAFRYMGGGDPRKSAPYQKGEFIVQELGAQLVAYALGARPGERVLDVCAGRGQKTSLLASQVGEGGELVATDLHDHKVRALREEMLRLELKVDARVWDWTLPPPPSLTGIFDRVLVDAPCTGVGTISRRPEIARRLTPEDPARMSELQFLISRNAAKALKPGGHLLFATCSVLREEAEAVVEPLLAEASLSAAIPPTDVDEALFPLQGESRANIRLGPQTHGTDGYFIARLRSELG